MYVMFDLLIGCIFLFIDAPDGSSERMSFYSTFQLTDFNEINVKCSKWWDMQIFAYSKQEFRQQYETGRLMLLLFYSMTFFCSRYLLEIRQVQSISLQLFCDSTSANRTKWLNHTLVIHLNWNKEERKQPSRMMKKWHLQCCI